MSRRKLYQHFISTNWNGLSEKIKELKKKRTKKK